MAEQDNGPRPIPWWRTPGALIMWAIIGFALVTLVLGPLLWLLAAALLRILFGDAEMSL